MEGFKGTPGPWVADIRGGCAAIYPLCRTDDTPGCHHDDDRNIAFSSKNAKYNGMHWEIDDSVERDFNLMAASPDLLSALQQLLEIYDDNSGKVWTTSSKRRALDNARAAVNKALGETK